LEQSQVEKFDLLSSRIFLGRGAVEHLPEVLDSIKIDGKRYFLLTDENTHDHCLPLLANYLPEDIPEFKLIPGENSKNLENAERIWRWLIECKASRGDVLINLGGGVVSDIGGFVASTFKRGISYINIPTSLMAQVDASIGGKTALNLASAKNQVGSFYQPHAVLVDTMFLESLPQDHIRNGYAEIIKSALLTGQDRWNQTREKRWDVTNEWSALISDTVKMKAMIVARDPNEAGIRNILNFGHTLGHSFEAFSLEAYPPGLLHGDAITYGMIGELFISWRMGHICWSEMVEITSFLRRNFPEPPFNADDKLKLLEIMTHDKKSRFQSIKISTLKKIGEPLWGIDCNEENLIKAIDYVLKDKQA
jgi:3-dehydroquinate synthase